MNIKLIAAVTAGLLSAAPAFSSTITLDFEGATSFSSIDGFYNGGTDSAGAAGANVGVSFGLDALALSNDELGPYFSNAPSPLSIMTPVGSAAALNFTNGFSGLASFSYSSTASTTVSVFSELDGAGTPLGTFNLSANAQTGCSDTPYCHWDVATLEFAGLAKSIQFGEAAYLAGFDNVAVAPVPLPAAAWLLLSGIGGLGTVMRRRKVIAA